MRKLLVIDADEIVYKVGFGSQRTDQYIKIGDNTYGPFKTKTLAAEWLGDGEADELYSEVVPASPKAMEKKLKETLNKIIVDVGADDHRLYLSGKDNFRYEVATLLPYKGNRSKTGKPFYYDTIKELIANEYKAITIEGAEADDAMSITSWNHQLRKSPSWEVVIATQDKDLKMVPGLHYNPTSRKNYHMSVHEAKYCFYHQLLTGDTTDNIPGVSGIGPTKATKLLEPVKEGSSGDMYNVIFKAYSDCFNNEKTAVKMPGDKRGHERIEEVARLLWMQQSKGQMWTRERAYYEE